MKYLKSAYLLLIVPLFLIAADLSHADDGAGLPVAPAQHIMAAMTASDGSIWVATEGKGVYRCADAKSWQAMHTLPGYPDSTCAYTLAQDGLGRIWVGTDCEGVAVWNGKQWRRYLPMHGIGGEHVYDIAVSGNGRLVAMATSGGLSIYDCKEDRWWPVINRTHGLPEDQIAALCFDAGGTLHLAFPTAGIAKAKPPYLKWELTQTHWTRDAAGRMPKPAEPCGGGIPCNLSNAILSGGNTLWLGTCAGLARGKDGEWVFTRGENYKAINKDIYGGMPKEYIKSPALPIGMKTPALLPEDHVTALHATPEGIWVGLRKKGAVLLNPADMSIVQRSLDKQKNMRARWVREFITLPQGDVYAATYGGGLLKVGVTKKIPVLKKKRRDHIPFPSVIAAPSDDELERLDERYRSLLKKQKSAPDAFFAEEDWATRGDWCERYGRRCAILCAVQACFGNGGYNISPDIAVRAHVGYPRKPGEFLRHWIEIKNAPKNVNILYDPELAMRTEAEWDDHGEEYTENLDGPDLWVNIYVPKGEHRVSFYFFNPNGRTGRNGYRDYLLELRKWPSSVPLNDILIYDNRIPKSRKEEVVTLRRNITKEQVLARTRVNYFAGAGVYKTFIARGPAAYAIRICRNNSFNTLLNGVFVEELVEHSYNHDIKKITRRYGLKRPAPRPFIAAKEKDIPYDAMQLWTRALRKRPTPAAWSASRELLKDTYNHVARRYGHDHPLTENWRWQIKYWLPQDRTYIHHALLEAWRSVQDYDEYKRSKLRYPDSPETIGLDYKELKTLEMLKIDWRDYLPGKTPKVPLSKIGFKLKNKKEPSRADHFFDDLVEEARQQARKKLPNTYE